MILRGIQPFIYLLLIIEIMIVLICDKMRTFKLSQYGPGDKQIFIFSYFISLRMNY